MNILSIDFDYFIEADQDRDLNSEGGISSMAKTWHDFWENGAMPKNDYDLAVISDMIWKLGTLEDIQAAVSPEVFHLFIAMNTIGNWEGDGWGCMIGDNPLLLPYIPQSLKFTGFDTIAAALDNVLSIFPEFTVFQDDGVYCDIINFLQNVRFKVSDARLKEYSTQQRAEMSTQFRLSIEELENVTDPLWGESKGWALILNQISL